MQETNESKLTIVDGVVERCEKTVAGRAVIPEGVTRIGEGHSRIALASSG